MTTPERTLLALILGTLALGTVIACAQSPKGAAPAAGTLAPLAAKPGFIVGRATFEDGRPVPDFTVSAESGFGRAGKTQGSAGRYSIQVTDPNIFIVQNIIGKAVLPYQGQTYLLPMHPADGLPDGMATNNFRGDVKKGVVRDFVMRLSGLAPGGQTTPPAPNVSETDAFSIRTSFEGCPVQIELARESAGLENATLQMTLTPSGLLIDGSAGHVVQRSIPKVNPNFYYYLYDIPLGVYIASASAIGGDGVPKPLHLKMTVPTTPVTSGPDLQSALSMTWPFDAKYELLARPVLTIFP